MVPTIGDKLRRRHRGRVATVLVTASVATVLAACGSSSGGNAGSSSGTASGGKAIANKTAYVISCTDANPWCAAFNKDMKAGLTSGGVKTTVLANAFDPQQEAQQFNQAISQKPGAIIVYPADPKASVPAIVRAKAAGIPVITVISQLDTSGASAVALSLYDNAENDGKLLGGEVTRALTAQGKKAANILVVQGVASSVRDNTIKKSFISALTGTPGFKVVDTLIAQYDQGTAEKLVAQAIAQYKGKGGIQAIIATGDGMATGAVQAAEQLNVPLGKDGLIVVGAGCFPSALPNIQSGKQVASLNVTPGPSAKFYVAQSLKLFAGNKVPASIPKNYEILNQANFSTMSESCRF